MARENCIDLNSKSSNNIEFLVVDSNCEPLIGLKSLIELNLIKHLNIDSLFKLPTKKEEFVEKFNLLFQGLGKLPNKQSIVLRSDSKPVLHYKKIIKRVSPKLTGRIGKRTE